jgi:methionyl-tRNA formyltransferase
VPSLDALAALAAREDIDLAGVVTQPDRPGDRGRVEPSPVKRRAAELGLTVLQPVLLNGDAVQPIAGLRADALVWAAYGNLIPRRLIDGVDGRAVNVHASLLPRWRGAAPVAHAILAGDRETGVTLMQGTASLDRGPLIAAATTPIAPEETAGELTERLARLGGALLERELPAYLARGAQHGTLELRDGVPHVAAGAGWLRLDELKPAGKRAMSGAEWARGLRDRGAEARLPS